jgi:hypothetical protein
MSFISYRLVLLLAICAAAVTAADFYASPQGSTSGDGSISRPWDLKTALGGGRGIRPGDTLHLRAGSYSAPTGKYFYSKIYGAAGAPIVIRPYANEHVIINGGIDISGAWVIFRDLEVTSTSTKRITSQRGPLPTDIDTTVGFNIFASNVKVVNNVIHNTGGGVDTWVRAPDVEIYGNLIYYNGWIGSDRAHGHGIYGQNSTGVARLIDNVIFQQFSHGIHIYGSSEADINNFYLEGNTLFNNGSFGKEYTRNILLGGGRLARNPVLLKNYTYFPTVMTKGGGDNNIGHWPYGGGCSNLKLDDNYFVSGSVALTTMCTVTSLRGNTLFGMARNFTPAQYPENTYLTGRPSKVDVFVQPNRYEPGRANIVVFNWIRADFATVDISGLGLNPGQAFEIHDAQNFYGPPILKGTYTSNLVSIPMTSTAVAPVKGAVPTPPVHTDKEFGAFVLRAVGSGTSPGETDDKQSGDTQPPTVTITAPASGQKISGLVTITAAATDNVGVAGVRFAVDGVNTGAEDLYAPYTVTLDTSKLASGVHRITATARDSAGNVAQSLAVLADVYNQPSLQASNVLAGSVTQNSAAITWNTNLPATAKVEYGTTASLGSASAVRTTLLTSHSISLSGLTSNTQYYYRVVSSDAGMRTVTAGPFTFKTASAAAAPPPAGQWSYYMEAESSTRYGLNIVNAADVRAGKYVSPKTGATVVLLHGQVNARYAGTYYVWVRLKKLSGAAGSPTVTLAQGSPKAVPVAAAVSTAWQWVPVGPAGQLKAGWSLLTLDFRGSALAVDSLLVTNDPNLRP